MFFLLPTIGSLVDNRAYFALHPGVQSKTDPSLPSCILLENRLYMVLNIWPSEFIHLAFQPCLLRNDYSRESAELYIRQCETNLNL